MEKSKLEILKANWLENQKWAHELNQILGAEHPKSIKQWEECNKIKQQMQDGE